MGQPGLSQLAPSHPIASHPRRMVQCALYDLPGLLGAMPPLLWEWIPRRCPPSSWFLIRSFASLCNSTYVLFSSASTSRPPASLVRLPGPFSACLKHTREAESTKPSSSPPCSLYSTCSSTPPNALPTGNLFLYKVLWRFYSTVPAATLPVLYY